MVFSSSLSSDRNDLLTKKTWIMSVCRYSLGMWLQGGEFGGSLVVGWGSGKGEEFGGSLVVGWGSGKGGDSLVVGWGSGKFCCLCR